MENKHIAYRQQIQRYSKEEYRLWEDLLHGMFSGTQAFIEKIKRRHLADASHAEIPVQKHLKKDIDADAVIVKAANFLSGDPQRYRKAGRISAAEKLKRDLLIYLQ